MGPLPKCFQVVQNLSQVGRVPRQISRTSRNRLAGQSCEIPSKCCEIDHGQPRRKLCAKVRGYWDPKKQGMRQIETITFFIDLN